MGPYIRIPDPIALTPSHPSQVRLALLKALPTDKPEAAARNRKE
jgi:hypothetical protein